MNTLEVLEKNLLKKYNKKSFEDFSRADRYDISVKESLSEEFLEKYPSVVMWDWVSTTQKLSEAFIERNSDRVHWVNISRYQKLSKEFIVRNSDKVFHFFISKYQEV